MYRLNVFAFAILALLFFGIKTLAHSAQLDDIRCRFSDPTVKLATDFKNKTVTVRGFKWPLVTSTPSAKATPLENENSQGPSKGETEPEHEYHKTYKIGQTDIFYKGDKDEITLLMTFHDALLRVEFYHEGSDGQTDEEYVHTGTLIRGDRRWVGGCQTLGKLPLPFELKD